MSWRMSEEDRELVKRRLKELRSDIAKANAELAAKNKPEAIKAAVEQAVVKRKRRQVNNGIYVKRWRVNNPEKLRASQIKRLYGLAWTDYQAMLEAQGHRCAICSFDLTSTKRQPHVDHCHLSGTVRGILCQPCNIRLGWMENNSAIIADYLARAAKQQRQATSEQTDAA